MVTCECQPCNKLHAYTRGEVLSSLSRQPVVLAAVLLGTEVVTFTDQDGKFFFEVTTIEGGVSLLVQEVRHKQVQVDIDLRRSTIRRDVTIVMEYIEEVIVVEKIQLGIKLEMNTSEMTGINGSILVPRNSLLAPHSYTVYHGPGHILQSLYHMDSRPDFTSDAIQSMVYSDSKGADFSIQSHVLGSLRIVGETGQTLNLKQGSQIVIKVSIWFDAILEASQVKGLHIFTYSDRGSDWKDNGRVRILSIQQFSYRTLVTLHAKLRNSNLVWSIGFPSRISCYIKAKVFRLLSKQEQTDITIQLEQSMDNLDRPSFYLTSAKTAATGGVCLQAVCSLGGLVHIMDTGFGGKLYREAMYPTTEHAVMMDNNSQVMFYNVGKNLITNVSSTPYYQTHEQCISSGPEKTGFFTFLINSSSLKLKYTPSILTPIGTVLTNNSLDSGKYCYIKAAVYDCSHYADIQVLSYAQTNHSHLLSMSAKTLPPAALDNQIQDFEDCSQSGVVELRASCLQYSCGSDVHISMTIRTAEEIQKPDATGERCRYWSSHPNLSGSIHLAHSMQSFHLTDSGVGDGSRGGLYRAASRGLAIRQCQAGDATRPTKVMNPHKGIAVTFTC